MSLVDQVRSRLEEIRSRVSKVAPLQILGERKGGILSNMLGSSGVLSRPFMDMFPKVKERIEAVRTKGILEGISREGTTTDVSTPPTVTAQPVNEKKLLRG